MEHPNESEFHSSNDSPVLLKQRYEIEKKIGEGGFAETFLAYDRNTRNRCVLKMLTWKDVPDWKVIELFEREARVLSHLEHPQIPHFMEFFTERMGDQTRIVLVQEYIEGTNLAEQIQAGKHYTEKEAIKIGLEVTGILEYLQDFSPPIIHRDIKPSNLLLSENQQLHLIDFGAVRDKVLHYQKTEAAGFTVVGTYGFMPFEQFQGQAVPASDIYSLGVTLITLLSHKEPHEMQLTGTELEFDSYVNISNDFRSVLKKMIAHRIEDRYANARELRQDLEALLAGEKPQAIRATRTSLKKKLSSGTVVALTLLLFVGLFAMFRKPSIIPPPPKQAPARVLDRQPALTPPYTGKVVRGRALYNGLPVAEITQVRPTFWFRNESTGTVATAQVQYDNGKFVIHGLPPGSYGVQVHFDSNKQNAYSYPGDLRAWETFTVMDEADTTLQVDLQRVIHLLQPEDNGTVLPNWNRCCEEGKPSHPERVQVKWKAIAPNAQYDYSISRIRCPYESMGSVASGTTEETSVVLQLPPNKPDEYYILQLHARKEGQSIGMLMTHGANGYGWDYRFRVN